MARVRLALLCAAAVAAAAGTFGGDASAGAAKTLDPNHLPVLPAQGLIVPQSNGLTLMGLDGHVYGRLAGFLTYPNKAGSNGPRFVHNAGIQALQQADPSIVTVYDSQGRGWLLDAAGRRLVRVSSFDVSLAGKAKLSIKVNGNDAGLTTTAFVKRAGKTLLSGDVTVIGTRYVSTQNFDSKVSGVLLDLVTGHRWKLLPECFVGGVVQGRAIAACAPVVNPNGRRSYHLYSFARNGSHRTLATLEPGLYIQSASLSPDSRWLLVYTAPGCGPGWQAVYPAAGGTGRFVTGDGRVPVKGGLPKSRYSFALGWTSDNRIVADINAPKGSSCEKDVTSGTFVLDPSTLKGTHLTSRRAALMWNPLSG